MTPAGHARGASGVPLAGDGPAAAAPGVRADAAVSGAGG